MKLFKAVLLSVFLLFGFKGVMAQTEPCKVLKPEISGKYTGECKKGLANGIGTAEGTDKYAGEFKKGLPDGKGVYTWANGTVYDGEWKKGQQSGAGKYTLKVNGKDSIAEGYWKDDKYIGKEREVKKYKIGTKINVERARIVHNGDGNQITVKFMQMGVNNAPFELDILTSSGNTTKSSYSILIENYRAPMQCKITYKTMNKLKSQTVSCTFEFEILMQGNYEVVLDN